jgi:short subunit dehydrogenase-like uncharacterized protein
MKETAQMKKTLMIYGATGYTGRMASGYAKDAGLDLILAGRDEARISALGSELGVKTRVLALSDASAIDTALSDVSVVLNCAGPFKRTAEPLMKAAIRTGTHYLDVAAELGGYLLAESFDEEARSAGVMLLPGSGGSVAMLGSLAGVAASSISQAERISIALRVSGPMSRGSAITASDSLSPQCLVRVNGALEPRDPAGVQDFDFGAGPVSCFPVTLPDLVTLWHSTQIPNIETFVHLAGNAFPSGDLADLPEGPDTTELQANRYQAAVVVRGKNGTIARALLDTVNGYTFTALASVEAARRVLAGEAVAGFQTPVGVFGDSFAETIADTRIAKV